MRATNNFLPRSSSLDHKGSAIDPTESRYSITTFGDFSGIDKMRNTKSILYIMLAFIAMAYTGVTFVFSILAYSETSSRTWHISQLVDNWRNKPIVAISAAANETHCSIGFEPIVSRVWPGTFLGCYCSADVGLPILRGSIVTGECDTIQRFYNCETISRQNPIYIRSFYYQKMI